MSKASLEEPIPFWIGTIHGLLYIQTMPDGMACRKRLDTASTVKSRSHHETGITTAYVGFIHTDATR